jgi:predicted transcriptional regulator
MPLDSMFGLASAAKGGNTGNDNQNRYKVCDFPFDGDKPGNQNPPPKCYGRTPRWWKIVKGMGYRSRTEIISQILDTANCGITKTKLMYKVSLSHDQLKEYLAVLTQSDLLRYDFVRRTFMTTKKGLTFLNLYNQIDHLMKEEEQKI